MINKVFKLSLATSLACLSLNAGATSEELLNKINALQKQVKELQKKQAEQEDANDELSDRIDEVETSTLTDKLNFGFEFRTRIDNFHQKQANGDKHDFGDIWSNRLRLNMYSKISDNMKFTGRLSMYKNWADNYPYPYSGMDPLQGRRPSDSKVYVERAYVDWRVVDGKVPLILTIGRQPSSDGPSHQFKDNTVRKSTYSALSFDGAADGVVATLPLKKLSDVDGMAVRVAYGKGYQENTSNTYVGNPNGIKDTKVAGAFFESGLGIDGSLLQLSVVSMKDVASLTQNASGKSTNTNIGDIDLYTAMIELTNIKGSGLDLFAHYGQSIAKPNGETPNYGYDFNGDGQADMNMPVGLLTSTSGDKSDKTGSAYWIGMRYTLPIASMKHPKIGLEYNHGSKNWFSFTQGSNDITNKLATRGSATEIYYIQPINRYAFLRLGTQQIDYEYTGSGWQVGAPMKMSAAKSMNPTALDTLTNNYILFNVKY